MTSTLSPSNTIVLKAFGEYKIQTEVELTVLVSSFQEQNGQGVMETEHFAARIDRSERSWLTQTTLSGYVGPGYVSAGLDTDRQFTEVYTTTSPELHYTINFTTPGTYTVWLRGYAPNAAGDSVYVGLDDQPGILLTGFTPQSWTWADRTLQGEAVTITITQPGLHTFHLWQREDGLRLDRIVLTTNSDYNPSGNGPPESEWE